MLASTKIPRKSTVSCNGTMVNKDVMLIVERLYPCIFLVVKISTVSNVSFKLFTHKVSLTGFNNYDIHLLADVARCCSSIQWVYVARLPCEASANYTLVEFENKLVRFAF